MDGTPVKPTLLLGNDSSDNVMQLLGLLRRGPYNIYWHQGRLYNLRWNRARELELIPLTRESLIYFVESQVVIQRLDGRGKTVAGLASETALLTLNAPEEAMDAAGMPFLEQVVEGVTVDRNGVTVVTPGYHPETATYMNLPPTLIVPEHPTAHDVERARNLLVQPFADFPFVTDVDRLNILSLPVTLIVRPYIDAPTPLYAINAQQAGAGKSVLAILACRLARTRIDVKTPLDDEGEIRKTITSALASQQPVYCIDNIPAESHMLDSPTLQAYLTASRWSDRMLGSNTLGQYRADMVVIATGINLSMGVETGRRSLPIMLAPRPETPSDEVYTPDPTPAEYLAFQQAWGTIMRAWEQQGRPRGKARLPSFDVWASVVSGILNVMGLPGDNLGSNQRAFRSKRDTDRQELQEFVEAWWAEFADAEVMAAQLCERLLDGSELLATLLRRSSRPMSRDTLALSLGMILRRREGTQVGPYQWQAVGMDHKRHVRLFQLVCHCAQVASKKQPPVEEEDAEGAF